MTSRQDDDPFGDNEDIERTVIMPAPGGRRRTFTEAPMQPPSPRPRPGGPSRRQESTSVIEAAGDNPLVEAAATAFALVRRLRDVPDHNDVAGLRESVLALIKEFEAKSRSLGANREAAYAARYALCALIDETILGTPWGSSSIWNKQSLLATLHNETGGGEKFFQIVDRMSENAARNIDLLELLYVCLCLGFQGRYGVMDRGFAQLQEVEQELYRTIRNQRGDIDRELSVHWRGIQDRRPVVSRYIPLWVVPVAAVAVAVLLYLGFSYYLNRASDEVFVQLNGLAREAPQLRRPANAPPIIIEPVEPATPRQAERIRGLLEEEVRLGLVDVFDLGNSTKVVLRNTGAGLFASGSSSVNKTHRGLILTVGLALKDELGPFLVTGHTDSQPIRTLRFPSNWHLSSARAESVKDLMAQAIGTPNKLIAEGRADTEPVAPNDTAEGRRQNRRIEIFVPNK